MLKPKGNSGSLSEDIVRYYLQGKEATRLNVGIGVLELARTKELITRHLSEPPKRIVDVGGGPGVYACWLARAGHEVHLVDAVALHVEQARQASEAQPDTPLASCTLGDARRLDLPHQFADTILLFGPLYHLVEKSDRILTLNECLRVLRPGGLLMAVGISRFASLHVGIVRWWIDDATFQEMVKNELADGKHVPPQSWPTLFTTAYFHQPDELVMEISEAGFEHITTLAIEGAGWLAPDLEERWQTPAKRQALLTAVRWTESEQTTLGISPHIMVVARKPGSVLANDEPAGNAPGPDRPHKPSE